jgi:ribosome maturation factor RimP
MSPYFIPKNMEINEIIQTVNNFIWNEIPEKELFIVEADINKDKQITIVLDSFHSVGIDDCADVSRHLEKTFETITDEYEITVSSAGLSSPFKIPRQYKKYVGKEIEVTNRKGEKIIIQLLTAEEDLITGVEKKKVKNDQTRKKEEISILHTIQYSDIKKALPHIHFKNIK